MDKLTRYRKLVQNAMREYARLYNLKPKPGVETILIEDTDHDNYLLQTLGWSADDRIQRNILYVRLRDGKIWIEEDWTEEGIATDLVRAGVPREDIVLTFQPPDMRKLTEFATA